ncbi:MAG TPA: hypothetical protein VFU54_19760 [Actinomycetota bacterium]|nr:hypothetical protein [Actinomycetota bacterium]
MDALGIYAVVAYMDTVAGRGSPPRRDARRTAGLAGVAEKAGAEFRYGAPVERVEGARAGSRASVSPAASCCPQATWS